MSYNKRSKEYDWFKGNEQEKKSPKESLKVVWKFTKIFAMFSLFFFSMWGCVQSFIIKTDNSIGKGVEFFQSESNISPSITRLNVTKDVKGIYGTSIEKGVVWLNQKEDKQVLDDVQKSITNGTGNNNTNILMSDATDGYNKAFGIKIDNNKTKVTKGTNGEYLAVSTAATTSKFNVTLNDDLKTFIIYQRDKNNSKKYNKKEYTLVPNDKQLKSNTFEQVLYQYRLAILEKYKEEIDKLGSSAEHLNTSENIIGIDNASDTTINLINRHNASTQILLKFIGASTKVLIGTETVNEFNMNNYFFEKNGKQVKTTFKPIVTWKHAWVRGTGPFYGLFVYPISVFSNAIIESIPFFNGWESLISIVLIVFLLRIFSFGLSFKSVLQQTKQQEIQAKKAIIDAKYVNYKGNKQMEAKQRQEVSELYKKEGISPLGAIGSLFLTMPIFLSIWRIIGGVQQFKATTWLGMQFTATSYKELFAGNWQYLPIIILSGASAAFSQLFPRLLTKKRDGHRINIQQKEAMKKNNKTQNIVMVVFVLFALAFTAGIQLYWIIGAIWQVFQTLITHHVIIWQKKRNKERVR